MREYLFDLGAWLSLGLNRFVLFGQYETLCARLGRSIAQERWPAVLPWPKSVRDHFLAEYREG
jgi:hypothetical protein